MQKKNKKKQQQQYTKIQLPQLLKSIIITKILKSLIINIDFESWNLMYSSQVTIDNRLATY